MELGCRIAAPASHAPLLSPPPAGRPEGADPSSNESRRVFDYRASRSHRSHPPWGSRSPFPRSISVGVEFALVQPVNLALVVVQVGGRPDRRSSPRIALAVLIGPFAPPAGGRGRFPSLGASGKLKLFHDREVTPLDGGLQCLPHISFKRDPMCVQSVSPNCRRFRSKVAAIHANSTAPAKAMR